MRAPTVREGLLISFLDLVRGGFSTLFFMPRPRITKFRENKGDREAAEAVKDSGRVETVTLFGLGPWTER